MAQYNYTNASISALFKTKYGKLSEAVVNTSYPTLSRVKKLSDFTGKSKTWPQGLTLGGSVGSRILPTANLAIWKEVSLTRKKVYGRLEVERETIKAAMGGNEAAFISETKEYVKQVVKSYARNEARILFNDGTGSLGTINSVTVSAAPLFEFTVTAAAWKLANWEEGDYINFDVDTDPFEVTEVVPSTKTIKVTRISGSTSPSNGDVCYMQNSKDSDPQGIKGVADFSSGSLYGISYQRRWSPEVKSVATSLTYDMMNEVVLGMQAKTGVVPDYITTSFKQFRTLLGLSDDLKHYEIRPRDKEFESLISFSGVQYLSTAGAIPIIPDQFVEDDRMYFLNTEYMSTHRAPDFGWFDEDNSVLGRKTDDDAYEARYGGYYNNFINPAYVGVIKGLT